MWVQANTVIQKPDHVDVDTISILNDIYKLSHFVTLTVDVMFVHKIPVYYSI